MSCNLIQISRAVLNAFAPGAIPTRAQVMHLIRFNGPVGNIPQGTSTPDESGATNLAYSTYYSNEATINGSTVGKFVGNSYINLKHTAAHSLGTGDFTLELWLQPRSMQYGSIANYPYTGFFAKASSSSTSQNSLVGRMDATGKINFGTGSKVLIESAENVLKLGAWTHVALTRKDGVLKLWVNGRIVATVEAANWSISDFGNCHLGFGTYNTTGTYFDGYIEEFRLVRGLAVYSDDFEPPTTPFIMPAA